MNSPKVVRFAKNTVGRDIAVGDVHGCFSKLREELAAIGFDPAVDRLFSVGDLVDRGPESEQVLDWLAQPWFHAIQGNHEDMAIHHALHGDIDQRIYIGNGGGWFLGLPVAEQRDIAMAFDSLPIAMEVETDDGVVGIVHADCPADSWQEMVERINADAEKPITHRWSINQCMWSRDRISSMYDGGVSGVRAVVVGHTPLDNPQRLGNVFYIDTKGWRGRHFTFLNLASLAVIQPADAKEAANGFARAN